MKLGDKAGDQLQTSERRGGKAVKRASSGVSVRLKKYTKALSETLDLNRRGRQFDV